MGLRPRIFFIFLLLTLISLHCKDKKETKEGKKFIDEIGNEITLKHKPTRIISTAPNITETIFAINAQNLLVGRTSFCNYPEEVKNIPIIGDLLNVNFEKVIDLKPDLIFITVEGNTKEIFDKLKSLGIEVYVTNPRSINGIINSIKNISEVLDKKDTAEILIKFLNQRLKNIKSQNIRKHSAMFVVSLAPLMIAGSNTFINDILNYAGFENISPESISSYPVISREEVLRKNPDWVILPEGFSKSEILKYYPEWKKLKAIRNDNIIFIDPDLFFRPGPRFIDAIELLVAKTKTR